VKNLGPKGFVSITVKEEVDALIQAITQRLSEETGMEVSKSQAVKICVESYVKEHEGGEKPG